VTVIRDVRGINLASLGGPRPPGEKTESAPARKEDAGDAAGLGAGLLVSSIRIADGRLRFVDRTVRPPAEYVVQHLDVRGTEVSPTTPVEVRAAAAVLGAERQNVTLEGTVGPAGPGSLPVDVTVRLDDVPPMAASGTFTMKGTVANRADGPPLVNGTATLRGVALAPPGAPRLADLDSRLQLRGDSAVVEPTRFTLNGVPVQAEATVERFQPVRVRWTATAAALDLERLGYGGPGVQRDEVLHDVRGSGTAEMLPDGPVVHTAVRSPRGTLRDVDYEGLEADVALAGKVATLDRLRLGAFGGTCEASGRVDATDAERPRFDTRTTIRGMTMKDLLAYAFPKAAGRFEGRLDATLALAGAGRDAEAVKRSARGQGRVDVRDGVLKEVNVADGVLGMTGVPGLVALVPPDIRSRYPELFGTGDTRFTELGGDVRIAEQWMATDNLRMAARDYAVAGKGGVGFDGRVDFTATLVASERLTADIAGRVKEAKYLTDEGGRLAVPFRLVGKMPGVKPVPDAQWVARTLSRAALGKGVGKILDEVAPKKKGRKDSPERERLRKSLEGLFGR
jgi:hypothetical protein